MLDLKARPDRPLVAASILSADFGRMVDDCRSVLDLGADLLHVDVMDGHFVGNLTMGGDMIKALRRGLPDVFIDVHLMVDRPGMYVKPFGDAGANHFTFHLEVCDPVRARGEDAGDMIDTIHAYGMTAGMAINPLTDVHGLEMYLDDIDMALVMSVHPGKSGQRFIPAVLGKTQWLDSRRGDGLRIEMDGGLNPQTAGPAAKAGCDVMVTASALFGTDDRASVINALHASGGAD